MFNFTHKVIKMYGITLLESCDDVYAQAIVDERLTLKTHYESLDIAGSNKIFYIKFQLPEIIPHQDDVLQLLLKETEQSEA